MSMQDHSIDDRVESALARMSLQEKAGQMFHSMVLAGKEGVPVPAGRGARAARWVAVNRPGGGLTPGNMFLNLPRIENLIRKRRITHFNIVGPIHNVRAFTRWQNKVQRMAAATESGLPVTFSTDPRHHFTDNVGTSAGAGAFSVWPETLGLAALRDPKITQEFADIARQEYVASGLRVALHPQIDLATEPRWSRAAGTFGEHAELTGDLGAAYITGFQTSELGAHSVSTMVKHFPGGGPQKDGEDPHFAYGREQVYPGGMFKHHLKPFLKAIDAGVTQMMPYYGMPVGTEHDEVGFAFNKTVITDLLRETLGFDGVVCADWGVLNDTKLLGEDAPARAWGLEHLSPLERAARAIDAGVDQFGGEFTPELVVELVTTGRVSESRVNESVRRILRNTVRLGLFDDPFVDPDNAGTVVGRHDFRAAGERAQRAAITLLTNNKLGTSPLAYACGIRVDAEPALPLARGVRVYAEGIERVPSHSIRVDRPEDADFAVLRLRTPYEKRPGGFETHFHAGSLAFAPDELDRILGILTTLPTVVDIYLDRPAVVPEIAGHAAALLANFGASEDALWDVLFGDAAPQGRLPFDMPRSMTAVESSREDVPFDTVDPLFRFGHGLRYET